MKILSFLNIYIIFILSFGCKSKIENIAMGYRNLGYFYQNYDLNLFKEKYSKVPFENLQLTTNLSKAPTEVYFYKDEIEDAQRGAVKYYELVVFVFLDNKLSTWGRLSDLKVHNDIEIRKVAEQVSLKLISQKNEGN